MYLEISYRSPWSNGEVSSHRRRTIGTLPFRFEMSSIAQVKLKYLAVLTMTFLAGDASLFLDCPVVAGWLNKI